MGGLLNLAGVILGDLGWNFVLDFGRSSETERNTGKKREEVGDWALWNS